MTRVALLGARGIGAVHARVLHGLGAEVCALAASSIASARATAVELSARLGRRVEPFGSVEECLDRAGTEAVVIATPVELHSAHLAAAAERGLAILCEKPLCWPAPMDAAGPSAVRREARTRLLLNLVSAHLVEAVRAELDEPRGDLEFEFHTLGRVTGEALAVDLLPHAFALLAGLQALDAPFEELELAFGQHRFEARFRQAGRAVRLDLRADPAGAKHLAFRVGHQRFTRRQEGSGAAYRLFLEDQAGVRRELEDPFVTRARRFLELCAGCGDWGHAREEAYANHAAVVRLLRGTPRRQRALDDEAQPCRA
jgi:hypothetical protein